MGGSSKAVGVDLEMKNEGIKEERRGKLRL